MNKKVLILSLLLVIVPFSVIRADSIPKVVSFKSVNNLVSSNFKVTNEQVEKFSKEKIFGSETLVEYLNGSTEKAVTADNKELSYLLDNNLLSYDVGFTYDKFSKVSADIQGVDFKTVNGKVSKNLFLMSLAKSAYGIQLSRPLYVNTSATRLVNNKQVSLTKPSDLHKPASLDKNEVLDYSLGDYYVYYSPNVYELYFKTLVDKGILNSSEISDVNLQTQLSTYASVENGVTVLPSWSPALGYYNLQSQTNPDGYSVADSNVLGSSYSVNSNSVTGSVSSSNSSYFFDNELLVIDALEYIEKALRLTEKEMTNTEAEIINYKYGASHLVNLDEKYKSTVMFLVAKGILNFEESKEFTSFYQTLDYDFFYTLMYRLHNPNARYDFSSIQLTDSDNYFLAQGLYKNSINFYLGSGPEASTTIKKTKKISSVRKIFGFLTIRDNPVADGEESYEVTKVIKAGNYTYMYEGKALNAGDDGYITLVNTITAKSPEIASAIVDSRLTYKVAGGSDTSLFIANIPAVSKVKKGNDNVTYVSKSALISNKAFNLLFTEDKYITNVDTGSRALLLNDNKIAIVGNEIIKVPDGVAVYGITGEVYYNLDIIARLFKDSQLKTLEPNSAYVLNNVVTFNMDLYDSVGSKISQLNLDNVSSKYYMDLTNTSHVNNYLIQDVTKYFGTSEKVVMLVELSYSMIQSGSVPLDGLISSTLDENGNGRVPSVSEVYNSVYEKPKDGILSEWWDSNIVFTNAMLNFMMDTDGVSYVKSGLLTPKITLLYAGDSSALAKDTNVLSGFVTSNFGLTDYFINRHGAFGKGSFLENYFRYNNTALPTASTGSEFGNTSSYTQLRSSRTFNFITADKLTNEKLGYTTFKEYMLTKTGKVLVDVTQYKLFDIEYQYTGSKIPSKILMKDTLRVDALEPSLWVPYNLNPNVKASITSNRSDGYSVISAKTVLTYKFNKNLGTFDSDMKAGISDVKALYADIDKVFSGFDHADINFKTFAGLMDSSVDPANGVYWMNDKFYKYNKANTRNPLDEIDRKSIADGTPIHYFPQALVKTSAIKVNSKGDLLAVVDNPTYDFKLLNSLSLTSHIIDSIYFNTSAFSSLKDIPNGAKVYIGGKTYTKKKEKLLSDVVYVKSNTLVGIDFTKYESYRSLLTNSIGNVPVTNLKTNKITTVSDYINGLELGPALSDSEFKGMTIIYKNGTKLVKSSSGTETNYSPGESILDSYAFEFSLNSSMKFRVLNSDKTLYSLVAVTNGNTTGFIDNIPYYNETLSFSDSIINGLDINGISFEEVDDLPGKADIFFGEFAALKASDIVKILKGWISNFCVILVVTNTIIWMIPRTTLSRFFEVLRKGNGIRPGPDLFRIFSCGLQTVDHRTHVLKVLSICVSLLLVVYFLRF